MRIPSVMNHSFGQVPKANIPRSQFNRSCGCKTTFDSGYLIPVFVDEALPGDTFNLKMKAFSRLATPIAPFMDNLVMDSFFFAVPVRLIWDNWQKFNGEQINPGDSTDYLVPIMTAPAGGYLVGSLSDYFGIPTQVAGLKHSALWHRAYNLIYNEWFRDQNLQNSVHLDRGDGPDDPANYKLLRRGKRHDYFTSCLPWPQKGPGVDVSLGGSAPIASTGNLSVTSNGLNPTYNLGSVSNIKFQAMGDLSKPYTPFFGYNLGRSDPSPVNPSFGDQSGLEIKSTEVDSKLSVDLSSATAVTINALRQAFQIQKLYERDARSGTRYTEVIRSHFGVVSPDARLQRPELLNTGSSFVNVSPVVQTSSTDSTSPQGNLAAMGTATLMGHGFIKSFTEHCVIIGLVSVRADLSYQQGLNRMFSRQTRWDYYWPALSHIGEQAVLNKEIYAQGTADDEHVFGYQERFAEYRYKPSIITGKFRSTSPQPLDIWHLAQDFANLPALNEEFIVENPPVQRVIAVPTEPHFLFDGYFDLKCVRPMPVYSVPGLMDHF